MSNLSVSVEGLWKQYQYGTPNHVTLRKQIQSWWALFRGRPDPNIPIEQMNALQHRLFSSNKFWALQDIHFEVHEGEALGILGHNGAGKSTLLKILCRVTAPTRGRIRVKGRLAGILEVGTGFHPSLTGKENVFLNGAILGMTKAEIKRKFDSILDFSGLEKFIDTPVKRYSTGMYMRLAFSVAAHLDPEILIVDEVLAVGDVDFQKKCLGLMRDIARDGRTVIFVSHNMDAISRLTNRCIVIKQGQMVFNGPTSEAIALHTLSRRKVSPGRIPVEQLECLKQWNRNPSIAITEIGFAKGQPAEITSGSNIRLELLLKASAPYKNLLIGYSIVNEAQMDVLTGFTPAFDIPKGNHLLEVALSDLDLAPGNYTLSLTLGTGSLLDNHQDLHSLIAEFCPFQVKMLRKDGEPVQNWDRNWAKVVHHSSSVEFIPENVDVEVMNAETHGRREF